MVEHDIVLNTGSTIGLQVDNNNYNLDFGISIKPGTPSGGNYNMLRNKPQIEGVTLQGNLLLTDFGTNNIYYNTTEGWNNQHDLIGKEGAIYIYSDHNTITNENDEIIDIPGIKIGDGLAYLIDAPFLDDTLSQNLIDMITMRTINLLESDNKLVSIEDRIRWNNKVSAMMSSELDSENLILSTLI